MLQDTQYIYYKRLVKRYVIKGTSETIIYSIFLTYDCVNITIIFEFLLGKHNPYVRKGISNLIVIGKSQKLIRRPNWLKFFSSFR